mmetsp:Transcript_4636/g.5235  ORF Transcript_4636/g.5235 Transcript_4636/m.5235 type:complete len:80 (+) Transcript_4636:662-901(+)
MVIWLSFMTSTISLFVRFSFMSLNRVPTTSSTGMPESISSPLEPIFASAFEFSLLRYLQKIIYGVTKYSQNYVLIKNFR